MEFTERKNGLRMADIRITFTLSEEAVRELKRRYGKNWRGNLAELANDGIYSTLNRPALDLEER